MLRITSFAGVKIKKAQWAFGLTAHVAKKVLPATDKLSAFGRLLRLPE
jgi:hypothetical protein